MTRFSRIQQALVMAVSVFIACVGATTVNFKNLCHFPIELIKTEWGHQSVKECDLGALGGNCSKSYDRNPTTAIMNFKDGWDGRDPTVAEFSFNTAERVDLYDIRIMSGYKGIWRMPTMQIVSSNGGPTLTSSWNADVYLSPNDCNKTREVPTGGTFDVTFCAGDTASTAGRSLGISKLKALLHQI